MSKYTPGPWAVEGWDAKTAQINVTAADGDGFSLYIAGAIAGLAEQEENARLIAAAPELLELLQEIVADDMTDFRKSLLVKAGAVIAKATGET